MTPCKCDNCDHVCAHEDLNRISDYSMRIEPCSEAPAGQCPECGALAYFDDEASQKARALDHAAPDLLAALKDAEEIIDRLWSMRAVRNEYGWDIGDDASHRLIRAAIAKADGA